MESIYIYRERERAREREVVYMDSIWANFTVGKRTRHEIIPAFWAFIVVVVVVVVAVGVQTHLFFENNNLTI